MNINLVILITLIFFISVASAHVCDDVLKDDPIEIKPEMKTIKIAKQGEFRISLKNNHYSSIHRVRMIPPENKFNINITPLWIEEVASKQQVFFTVNITIPEDIKPGVYPLILKVDAQEFKIAREVGLTIKIEEEETDVEITPEDIPVAISVFPDVIEVETKQATRFRVYIKNGHTESLHNITLYVEESRFEIDVAPEVIEEIKPGDRDYFVVDLTIPEDIEHGDYLLVLEVDADEFTVRRGRGAVIRVSEVKEEVTYLYLLVIFLILFVAIWRGVVLWRSKQRPEQ
jgi:uncharacterized membrane protein